MRICAGRQSGTGNWQSGWVRMVLWEYQNPGGVKIILVWRVGVHAWTWHGVLEHRWGREGVHMGKGVGDGSSTRRE